MVKIGEFDPLDKKYWGPPEPGFSATRNKQVIEDSIKKYEKQRARKMKEFTENLRERTDAAASYLKGMGGVDRSRSVEKYFGKRELAHLRAEDIRNQLIKQRMMTIGHNKQAVYEEKEKIKKFIKTTKPIKIKRTKTDGEKK